MIIEQLNIYPIKGLGGIQVQSALALERGFKNDRRFMLVDAQGTFISQRSHTEMALFKTSIIGDMVKVAYKNESILLDTRQEEGETIETTVWEHSVNTIKVGKEASEWFSEQLGQSCTLVKMNQASHRNKVLSKAPDNTQVSLADGYPYLLLGTASVELLNSKLENPVGMDRFRANIIVNTKVAHEEDDLDRCEINQLAFRVIKPCARCQVITIDQQLGIKSKEPLKTLSTYRKEENKVYFGANMVCMESGVVKVGDKITQR